MQKQVKEDLRVETQASWEKFCSSISLENDPRESWRKIKTSSSLRVSATIQQCATTTKSPRQTPIKCNSLPKWSKDTSASIESKHFDSNHFNDVNKFIEDNHRYFYSPKDPDDYRLDVGNEYEPVEDVDPQLLGKLGPVHINPGQ